MLLKKSNEEMSIHLSQAEKDAIDKGLQSVKNGNIKSDEEVADATRKKYPHLFK